MLGRPQRALSPRRAQVLTASPTVPAALSYRHSLHALIMMPSLHLLRRQCNLHAGAAKPAGEKEAGGKPPHSFLPNLQPGRVSPAARREQVLAGPLTRASTPQSRSQVSSMPLNP